MPITDLVRYFNAADQAGGSLLRLESGRAAARHHDLRLTSLFAPIVDVRSERIVGHQASLQVWRADGSPAFTVDAFSGCETNAAVVHLDRLCRTLHALNFLSQHGQTGGYLQVRVNARHVAAVPNQHGLVYEAILKRCGLAPEDIVLELAANDAASLLQLAPALESYQRRGYRLAFADVADAAALQQLLPLGPACIKFSHDAPAALIEQAHAAGVASQCDGIDSGAAYLAARARDLDLASGSLFGEPQPDCHATHSPATVAYNVSSPLESSHENRQ